MKGILDLKEEVLSDKCPESRTKTPSEAEKEETVSSEKEETDAEPETEVNPAVTGSP